VEKNSRKGRHLKKQKWLPGKLFLFFTALYLPLTGIHAQDSSVNVAGIKWTLQECIDYAKMHNVQINTFRLSQQSARQDLLLSKASRLPNLAGTASQYVSRGKNFNTLTGNLQDKTNINGNYSLGSSVTLYNGSYINNDIKQKDLLVQAGNLNILQGENDITLQVTQAFLNILLARENIVYLQDLVNTSAGQVNQQQQLFDAGSIAKKILVQMQAQYATDKYNLVIAQNAYRQNTITLKQLLLLSFDIPFDISAPDSVDVQRVYPPLAEAVSDALQNRPEVKNGQLNVQVAALDLEKAKAGLRPTLSANGAISSGYADQSGSYFRQVDNNFFQQIGLTLSVPIFNRRVTKTAEEKSKIEIAQSRLDLQNTKTVLSQQVEQAYINVQNAESQYDAAVEELKSAKESYRIANEQLQLGAVNIVELLLQKNLYVQALQAYTQAKYNTVLYIKIYVFYMGSPVKL
jgi:outer membrane protein